MGSVSLGAIVVIAFVINDVSMAYSDHMVFLSCIGGAKRIVVITSGHIAGGVAALLWHFLAFPKLADCFPPGNARLSQAVMVARCPQSSERRVLSLMVILCQVWPRRPLRGILSQSLALLGFLGPPSPGVSNHEPLPPHLYTEHTFRRLVRNGHGGPSKKNSIHVSDEIAPRKSTQEDLLIGHEAAPCLVAG